MIILKILINGIYLADSSLDYEKIHKLVQDNTYDSIGDAVISKFSDAIHHSEWYNHTPKDFDLVKDFDHIQAICGNNLVCYHDSLDWAIMNKTEFTADIYKFITDRVYVIKHGFSDNFLPDHIHWEAILNIIDWDFLIDCISFI